MNVLDRIKEIKLEDNGIGVVSDREKFLIKCIEVYREIAIDVQFQHGESNTLNSATKLVDDEFLERMEK